MLTSKKNILLGITGSIAAYKICSLISRLVKEGHEVRTVVTPSALHFIGASTLEGLTGIAPLSDTFTVGQQMAHIHWARWADLFLLAPASANTLNKYSSGHADNLLLSLLLAYENNKPLVVAPAMNTQMLHHPSTQNSLKLLQSWGGHVLASPSGELACGESGEGKLLEPDLIYDQLQIYLSAKVKSKNILITGGGTEEPIDGVRSISNLSTGTTASQIALRLSLSGHKITYLHGCRSKTAKETSHIQHIAFTSFSDLNDKIKEQLKNKKYDFVIHSAAVSDYSIKNLETPQGEKLSADISSKISSTGDLTIHLQKNHKIVDKIKSYSSQPLQLMAFKLTNTLDKSQQLQAVRKLFYPNPKSLDSAIDFVVHNDLHQIHKTHTNQHEFTIYNSISENETPQKIKSGKNLSELTQCIQQIINGDDL